MTEIIVAFVTGVLGPIIYLFVEKTVQNRKEQRKDKVKEQFFDSNIISVELDEIREEFQADRSWIIQFHNGGNFYPTGKSIQKFSVVHESLEVGISTLSKVFLNIPCSLYSKTFNYLLTSEDGGVMILDYDDVTANGYGWRSSNEFTGNKSTYLLPLFSLDDKFIGVLGIDYVFNKRKLTKDEWQSAKNHSYKLSGFLSKYLNN